MNKKNYQKIMEDLIRDTEVSDYQFRMNAIEKDMVSAGITSFTSSGDNVLTVAKVPTGINIGVSNLP